MHFEKSGGLGKPGISSFCSASPAKRSGVLLFTLAGLALRSLAEDVEVPDYFSSTRSPEKSPSPSQVGQQLTESDAETLIDHADDALTKLAGGDISAAYLFASIFGQTVDYYDEGQKTPSQIVSDKVAIFRNYRSYFSQRVGELVLSDTESPELKWVSFSYRYEIVKRSGGVLRGVADARWALLQVGGKLLVVATRETVHRR